MKSWKAILALAIPVAMQSVIRSMMNIFDQIMVGKLGAISVVSVGLATKIFLF